MMGFLAPLFALAALALVIPVVLHLIRRTPRGHTPFSSLMFLVPSPPRITRRSRLEHWWLLALRLLALALLVMAFTRPFIRRAARFFTPTSTGRQVAILLDTSASMHVQGVWANAIRAAQNVLHDLDPQDTVALFTCGERLTPVVDFGTTESRTAIAQKLRELTPTWHSGDMGSALVTLAERMLADGVTRVENAALQRQIVFISDFQEGLVLDGLRPVDWPGEVHVRAIGVGSRLGNASLYVLPMADSPSEYAVRVLNDRFAAREQYVVRWFQQVHTGRQVVGSERPVYVPAGQTRTVRMQMPQGSQIDGIELVGDQDEYGNVAFVAPVPPEIVRLLFVGPDNADDSDSLLYYIVQGLVDTPIRQFRTDNFSQLEKVSDALDQYRLIIVATTLPQDEISRLRQWIEQGGNLIVVVRQESEIDALGELLQTNISGEQTKVGDYSLWTNIDFQHPLFAPLSESKYRDFTKIRFWKYRRLRFSLDGRRIAEFDSGDPAIIEFSVGQGRVLLFSAGWHPDDSQWALSTKWVPMLQGCLEWAGLAGEPPLFALVGMPLPVPPNVPGSHSVTVVGPHGKAGKVSVAEINQVSTDSPGIYRIEWQTGSQAIAVNLQPRELRTAPQDPQVLEQFGVNMSPLHDTRRIAELARHMQDRELEQRQRVWWWCLFVALGVLTAETLLASWLSARKSDVARMAG